MFEHINDPELREVLRRFLSKVEDSSSNEKCWNWTAYRDYRGYGRAYYKSTAWPAHRFGYWLEYGKLSPRLVIDHLCGNTSCVNPLHLEEVDRPTNALRGYNFQSSKTHCKYGHEFTEENTHKRITIGRVSPRRVCRTCNIEYQRRVRRERALKVSNGH